MRSKLKWGPTIQQNNNVIYVVGESGSLGETIYTQAIQSIDTMSIPQEGRGGGGHLPNGGCVGSAKSRPGKNHKVLVQMMLSIRIDKSM